MNELEFVVRARAGLWRGRGILLLGESTESEGLLEELTSLGVVPIPGEWVTLDSRGRLLSAEGPVGIARAIVAGRAMDAWVGRPRGARAALAIVEHVAPPLPPPDHLLLVATALARVVVVRASLPPSAIRAAHHILASIDDALGRERLVAGGDAPVPAPHETYATAEESARVHEKRFLLLLHWHGRFGNRMHQYAYGATFSQLWGVPFWLPSDWEGTHLFAVQHHVIAPGAGFRARLNQLHKTENGWDERLAVAKGVFPELQFMDPHDPGQNYQEPSGPLAFDSMCAYHPSLFERMSRRHLLEVFAFSDEVKALDIYKRAEDRQGRYDIAHLRRDDISSAAYNQTHHQGYSVVSMESYVRAFKRYGFDPAAVEWVSDDRTGRWHVDRPKTAKGGWLYPHGSLRLHGIMFDWLEDFLRLYFARTIFRANSSFSWWAAFLAPHARVFSPVLDRRHIYGVDGMEEIDVEFAEGNHPHWMYGVPDIRIGD